MPIPHNNEHILSLRSSKVEALKGKADKRVDAEGSRAERAADYGLIVLIGVRGESD